MLRGYIAPCLTFLYSSDIYWLRPLKCSQSPAQKSKTPLGINVEVHFWIRESWTSALSCFFSQHTKFKSVTLWGIQHCCCQNKCCIIPFQNYSLNWHFILFFPLSEMIKECGMETQIIHGSHWNTHLLIYPIKCLEIQYTNRQWPPYMTTELLPTGSAGHSGS